MNPLALIFTAFLGLLKFFKLTLTRSGYEVHPTLDKVTEKKSVTDLEIRQPSLCRSFAQTTCWTRLRGRLGKRLAVTTLAVVSVPFLSPVTPQPALAQAVCTPDLVHTSATSIQGRDASGDPTGFDTDDLQVGDFIIYRNVVVAAYNPNATIDVVLEVSGINLNTAVPPAPPGGETIGLRPSGALAILDSRAIADNYVTFRLIPMLGGSVTSDIASGTVLRLQDAIVSIQDIDPVNLDSDNSDIGGISLSIAGSPTATLTDVVPLPFQNGGGPAGFATYTATPASTPPPNWDGADSGGNLDHFVDFSFGTFTGGEFVHGQTGSTTGTNNRGGAIGICGDIAPASMDVSKVLDSVVENADGSATVTYTVNLLNDGEQQLTGIQITDNLDGVFASPYDGFIPSTAANTSGGVLSIGATATIITDTGVPIGTLPTNPSFDGGTDTNVFDPTNVNILDPDDEISVTFSIRVEPNLTSGDAAFANDVAASTTDEFNLEVSETQSSDPVTPRA